MEEKVLPHSSRSVCSANVINQPCTSWDLAATHITHWVSVWDAVLTVVFCSSLLCYNLTKLQVCITDQEERTKAIEAFKGGKKDVLVATDVASKGLDFPAIQHVVNYDMPEEIENYGVWLESNFFQTIVALVILSVHLNAWIGRFLGILTMCVTFMLFYSAQNRQNRSIRKDWNSHNIYQQRMW